MLRGFLIVLLFIAVMSEARAQAPGTLPPSVEQTLREMNAFLAQDNARLGRELDVMREAMRGRALQSAPLPPKPEEPPPPVAKK